LHLKRTPLPPLLASWAERIRDWAVGYGLDFYEVIFELVGYDELNQVASYGGFPTRYPHWRFGMTYEQMSKGYTYGLHKIYELVINNDPCIAYLLRSNAVVDQKMVMAHVFGHADFFKHNQCFRSTNRKMLDEMANHATRVRRYIEAHGLEPVERFLDDCLTLENLIDIHRPFIKRRREVPRSELEEDAPKRTVHKLRSKSYMDRYLNPPSFVEEQRRQIEEELEKRRRHPAEPERDVLLFLLENAPLERWQRDVLDMVREEAYYFAPQGQTKILNEGWASFWHSTIMTQKALEDSELIDYASNHAGTMGSQPGALNPYKVGLELLRHIEDRWNKGRFGREWGRCDDMDRRRAWDTGAMRGRSKIFEVRRNYTDLMFIDEFLTEDFCHQHRLFTYEYDAQTGEYVITSRDFKEIKEKLLRQLTNFGQPVIYVEDANHDNRGELYMRHAFDGLELKIDEARATLESLFRIWTRPVHVETVVERRRKVLSFDGQKHGERTIP
jgi:stage V sporulation protein R